MLLSDELKSNDPTSVSAALDVVMPEVMTKTRERGRTNLKDTRRRMIDGFPLDAVYRGELTGKPKGIGWLEARDPWSLSGDQDPSAGVATGEGIAERGSFHSFRTGETISVFDFLMKRDGLDIRGAFEEVARISGVEWKEDRTPGATSSTWSATSNTPTETSTIPTLPSGVDPRTDMANARRFVAAYGQIVRYCPERGGWLVWDGRRWQVDPEAAIVRGYMRACAAELANTAQGRIDEVLDAMKHAETAEERAALSVQKSESGKLRTWARDSQQSGRVSSSLTAAEELPGMMIRASVLDSDPWVLNCENGCVDLRTGKITPTTPEMMLTMISGTVWEEGESAEWTSFLEQILPDATVRDWLQRWAGTCLTGLISDRVIVMLVGVGANGKSVFLDALAHALGDYAATTSPEFFASSKNQNSSREYQVAQIQGVRMLRATETESGATLNESLLKQITGGDPCVGRHPYGRPFSFRPICKPVLATNNRPRLRDTSKAIYDRLAPIDFPVRFERVQQDRGLSEKLRTHASGILRWAWVGLQKWIADKERLTDCAAIVESVSDYRRDEDPLGDFLETKTVLGEDYRVSVAELFDAYHATATAEKVKEPLTKIKFGKLLKARGLAQSEPIKEGKTKIRKWIGIALVDSDGEARKQDRTNQPTLDLETEKVKRAAPGYQGEVVETIDDDTDEKGYWK